MSLDLHSSDSETRTINSSFPILDGLSSHADVGGAAVATLGPAQSVRYRIIKRVLDIAIILLASPVLIPIFLLAAAAVRLSSPGPIFFTHRRIRSHGTFFTMWKFRTMSVNSNEILEDYLRANPEARLEWQRTRKLRKDPRITPIGEFLRRTSIDELPQIWNVLNGSMSLVGPRPIVAAEVEKYGEFFADYCRVKPGITGLWQISGRSEVSYNYRVKLDCEYARNWSLARDLAILVRTLPSVINQDGAY